MNTALGRRGGERLRAAHDRVKDRLHIGGRTRDHAQDLAGRCLLLHGFAQGALQLDV
jgi:hypothetical protein